MSGTLVPRTLDVEPDVPLVEIPVSRPQDESRAAFTVVDRLLDSGIPKREILVVASTLQDYEPDLARAAIRRGLTPTFWTQLDLENTQLYRLLHGTVKLLGENRFHTATDLQTILAMGWTPPNPDEDAWPVTQLEAVNAFEGITPNSVESLAQWHTEFASRENADQVLTLLNWLGRDHSPAPQTVEAVLSGLVERYREYVLPTVMDDDGPALLDTETAARTTVRMETLVKQVAAKYRARRSSARMAAAWTNVASLIESVASQAPGRREHANALAIDVMEPNDVWPQKSKYVIVLGLVEGEWPSPADSQVPAELRDAINGGHEGAEAIVPRPSWTGGRAVDQFAEVLDAATDGVLLLRHTQTVEGEGVPPSSLLDMVPTSTAAEHEREALLRDTPADSEEILDEMGLTVALDGDGE